MIKSDASPVLLDFARAASQAIQIFLRRIHLSLYSPASILPDIGHAVYGQAANFRLGLRLTTTRSHSSPLRVEVVISKGNGHIETASAAPASLYKGISGPE